MQKGTITLRRDGLSLLEESQRSINENFATNTKNFELWETRLGFSFIMMPSATMFAINVVLPNVKTIS